MRAATIAATIPTTITTTIIQGNQRIDLCNINEDLYPINYGDYRTEVKCLKKIENKNYERIYFDEINQEFRPCFETCLTCQKSGNKIEHNCILCEPGYILKPEGNPKNNCVAYIVCP